MQWIGFYRRIHFVDPIYNFIHFGFNKTTNLNIRIFIFYPNLLVRYFS